MANSVTTIIGLRAEPDGIGGTITCPTAMRPAPGQYLTANSLDPAEPLPMILYPTGFKSNQLKIAAPLPAHWRIGTELRLRGPLGNGFHMPSTARRVAIAGLNNSLARMLPLIEQALKQDASVAVYAQAAPRELPAEVEILPVDLLPEAPQWADFLAFEISRSKLPGLRACLGLAPHQRLACSAQVMVISVMPCSGLAECGVCAVPTRSGWSLACSDGPVYEFGELDLSG